MIEIYKEEEFYQDNGGPTESFRYCRYCLNQKGDDYDEFALVINALYPYLRLAKMRGVNHFPCGRSSCPATDGWFAQLKDDERDRMCPKIAWGFAAEFLANLVYNCDQEDYVLLKPMGELIINYYNKYLNLFLESHNGLKYSNLTDIQKEFDFIHEHAEVCNTLWNKSEPLKAYSQLYEYALCAEEEYKRYIEERKCQLQKKQNEKMLTSDCAQANEVRTVIQNGGKSIYIENHTGPIIINSRISEVIDGVKVRDEAYFADIEHKIIETLDKARATIDVCVAWFTNQNLLDKLLDKTKEGVLVRVITFNDGVNKNHGVDLSQLDHKACRGERGGLLHDKFCVIDNAHVICGSYNWTKNAENKNDEDAEFHYNNCDFASSFTRRFNDIWRRDQKSLW